MVTGDRQHFMTGVAQPSEEFASLFELLGSGALREVAADDNQVGLFVIDAFAHGGD
jgi:hypothetical protein